MALLLALGLVPAFAAAQPGPLGPDISVTTEGYLACPAVAMSARGDFEVVWNHYFTYSHPIPQGMFGRHFDRQGRPTQPAAIHLDIPRCSPWWDCEVSYRSLVALPGAGYFVVWWERDGSRSTAFGRFLDWAGQPRGPVLLLKRHAVPLALALVSGKPLVAWKEGSEDSKGPVWARQFDLAGHALGKAMLLTKREQVVVLDLAPLADSFVAAWERRTGTSWVVEVQRFSLAGEPLGAALQVNEDQRDIGPFGVKVAANGNDRYAVAWTERTHTDQEFDSQPRVQFFDLSGARGPAMNPSELSAGSQQAWGLAMDSRGSTLVTWVSASPADVKGRFLDSTGEPAGKAFSLAQNLAVVSPFCSVAATREKGDAWIAAWLPWNTGIFARRLAFAAE